MKGGSRKNDDVRLCSEGQIEKNDHKFSSEKSGWMNFHEENVERMLTKEKNEQSRSNGKKRKVSKHLHVSPAAIMETKYYESK